MREFSGLVLDAQQKDRELAALDIEAARIQKKVPHDFMFHCTLWVDTSVFMSVPLGTCIMDSVSEDRNNKCIPLIMLRMPDDHPLLFCAYSATERMCGPNIYQFKEVSTAQPRHPFAGNR